MNMTDTKPNRVPLVKKPDSLWKRIKQSRHSYIMLLPFTLLFFTFVILPVLSSFVLSFTSFDMLRTPKPVGLDNYIRLFLYDDIFLIALKNTLLFAVLTGPLGYILSFIFAWFISELTPKVRSVLTLLLYAPSLTGNVYFIWTFIFSGDRYGIVNNVLTKLGIISDPIQWLTNTDTGFAVVVIVLLWMSMGTGFLSFIAGLQTVDRSLFEAGALDGIQNRWQELWFITLPQMVPQLLFGAIMSLSSAFAVGYQCMALTGFPSTDYSTHTVLLHMIDYGSIRFEMGYASSIAVVLFLIMFATWYLVNKFLRRMGGD